MIFYRTKKPDEIQPALNQLIISSKIYTQL